MSTIVTPANPVKHHWPLYWILYAICALAIGALHEQITVSTVSYGVGVMAIPGFVGWLAMRNALGSRQVILGYVVFIAFAAMLLYQEIRHQTRDMQAQIETGCLAQNKAVAALTDEDHKKQFCGCYSDQLASWAVRRTTVAAISFRQLTHAAQDPEFVAFATQVWNQCNRELVAK